MKRLCLMILAIGIIVVFTSFHEAYAEIALSPLTKTVQLSTGKSETVQYSIVNRGAKSIEVEIRAKSWFVLPENKNIEITDWLNLGIDKITLAKDEKKELNFNVTVPKEAVGELAAMIYFTPKVEEEAGLITSYGVSLYVFIQGTELVSVEIENIILTAREDKNYIAVEVKNNGNVHIRPHVKVLIEDKKTLKKEIELPFGKPIFGGQTYTFVGELKNLKLRKKIYKITAFVDYGNKDNIITKSVEVNR